MFSDSRKKMDETLVAAFLPAKDGAEPLPNFEILVIEGSQSTTVAIKAVDRQAYHYAFDNNFGEAEFRTQKRGAVVKVPGRVLVEPYARTRSDRVKLALRSCIGHSHLSVSVPEGAVVKVINVTADVNSDGEDITRELDRLKDRIHARIRTQSPALAAMLESLNLRRRERSGSSGSGLPAGLEAILGGLPPGLHMFTNIDDLMAAMGTGNGFDMEDILRSEPPVTGRDRSDNGRPAARPTTAGAPSQSV